MVKPTAETIIQDMQKACDEYKEHLEKEENILLQKSVQYYIDQKYENFKLNHLLISTQEAKEVYSDYKKLKNEAKKIALQSDSNDEKIDHDEKIYKKIKKYNELLASTPIKEQEKTEAKDYFFEKIHNPEARTNYNNLLLKREILSEFDKKLSEIQIGSNDEKTQMKNLEKFLTSKPNEKKFTFKGEKLSRAQVLGWRRKSVRDNNEESVAKKFRNWVDIFFVFALHKQPLGVTGGKFANSLFSHFKTFDKLQPTDSAPQQNSQDKQNNRIKPK